MKDKPLLIAFAVMTFALGMLTGALCHKEPDTPVGFNDPFYFDDTAVAKCVTIDKVPTGYNPDSFINQLQSYGWTVYNNDTIIHTVNK